MSSFENTAMSTSPNSPIGVRGEGMKLICPNIVDKYTTMYYDSTEVNDYNSDKLNNRGIEVSSRHLLVTKEALKDITRARMDVGWSRGSMFLKHLQLSRIYLQSIIRTEEQLDKERGEGTTCTNGWVQQRSRNISIEPKSYNLERRQSD
jgi:hypothetical protein